jgi:hypothetical protein
MTVTLYSNDENTPAILVTATATKPVSSESLTFKGDDARIESRSLSKDPTTGCWILEFQVSKDKPRYELRQRQTLIPLSPKRNRMTIRASLPLPSDGAYFLRTGPSPNKTRVERMTRIL